MCPKKTTSSRKSQTPKGKSGNLALASAKVKKVTILEDKEIPVEKRRYLRLEYSRLISFTHYDNESLVAIPGKMAAVKDLSEQGMLIETAEKLEPGNVLDLDIAFEQDKIIPTQAEVVHSRRVKKNIYHTGVKFLRIDEVDLIYLKNFLENQIKQKGLR